MSKNPVFNHPWVISNPRFIGMIHLSFMETLRLRSFNSGLIIQKPPLIRVFT